MPLPQVFRQIEHRLLRLYLGAKGIPLPKSATFTGLPVITLAPGSTFRVGERFNAVSSQRRQVMGLNHACVIRTISPGAQLLIGDDVGVSGVTLCAARRIEIGSNCLIGANVTIIDTNFHAMVPEEWWSPSVPEAEESDAVVIGCDVFIGAGAYILRGTTIGDRAIIGAGAVVSGEVPANAVFAGNPARAVTSRERSAPEAAPKRTSTA